MIRSMHRALAPLAITCLFGTGAVLVPSAASAAPAAESTVTGSAVAPGASALGAVSGSEKLTFQVWLATDTAGAARFADAVSSPGSPSYHRYLSPSAYTARFGPSEAEASRVASWLRSSGFSGVRTSGQRDYIAATGPVSTINRVFGVRMTKYRTSGPDGRTKTFQANDDDLAVPTSISGAVLSVTGLDTMPAEPTDAPADPPPPTAACSTYWAQNLQTITPAFHGAHQLPTPICGYKAAALRGVYGLTATDTGAGETIALIEDGTPVEGFQTLVDYAAANHLHAPSSTQFREEVIGQGNACGNPFVNEEQLDEEAAYAMAPQADQLMVDGDTCTTGLGGEVQALFDAENVVLGGNGDSPQADIVSNSWDFGGENMPSVYPRTAHAIDLRAAAEGVGMYFAAGDVPGVAGPASDPYSTAVGGTIVGIGADNTRVFETGQTVRTLLENTDGTRMNFGFAATGGGTSLLYDQPSYQKGVVPASMSTVPSNGHVDRTVPDIAADAAGVTPFQEGVIDPTTGNYSTFANHGTSLSTPLVAGIVADAQQGQPAGFGFINPLLHSLAGTSALTDVLPRSAYPSIDDRAAALSGPTGEIAVFGAHSPQLDQVTARGYDTVTGLGTPNGNKFIAGLRADR